MGRTKKTWGKPTPGWGSLPSASAVTANSSQDWIKNLLGSSACCSQICKVQFRKFDTNGDGVLQWSEVCNLSADLCHRLGISQGVEEGKLRVVFDTFDKNHDGVLSEEEFVGFFKAFLKSALPKVQTISAVHVEVCMVNGDVIYVAEVPGKTSVRELRKSLVVAGIDGAISGDLLVGPTIVAESVSLSSLLLESLQDLTTNDELEYKILLYLAINPGAPFKSPSFSFRCNPIREDLGSFMASLAKKTKFQLDSDLVAVLGHSLRFAGGNGYDIDPKGDEVIRALLEHGAGLSVENERKFLEVPSQLESRLERQTPDHGDADWCSDAYDGHGAMDKLKKRLQMIREFK